MYELFITDGSRLALNGDALPAGNADHLLITPDVVVSATLGIAAVIKYNTDNGISVRLPMDYLAGSGPARP